MLQLERHGGVARVFLDRPDKANALHSPLLVRLADALERLAREEDLRAVVLGGRGRSFCGGADVAELGSLDGRTARPFIERVQRACAALRALPVPVVARLHGAVIGAGLELAAACDLRIAAHGTRFAMPEVRLGIPSVVEAALLPRLAGAGRSAWLVLTGEPVDAERACAWGLVESTCAPEALDRELDRLLASLLAADAAALRMQKALLQMWQEQPLSASVARSIELFCEACRLRALR
ncbi:MAG TPA: enoyl-CoA hydratase-related protein [Burkholderiales bacterium]